ncbi:MAG: DMT family transporter [Melioribacteraceae bacterium]|nr:MAG: DMT family transporter [Melioribacteraceae bacterium]
MKKTLLTIWKPLAAVIFWGGSFIATKNLLGEISPLGVIYLRLILGILFIAVVAKKRKRSFAINLPDLKGVFLLALIASFHLWIQVTGLQYTSAANTGWIIGFAPVFMTILGFLFFKEKINFVQTSGIIIAFAGLLMLISKGDLSTLNIISNKGDLMILTSAFTWSVYSLVGKKITLNFPPIMTVLYLFIMMLLIITPFTINYENYNSVLSLSLAGWASILFLGILCSGLSYVIWAEAMKEMPASKVGAFLYLEPFVTVFTAWIFLAEEITLLMMLSGLVIIGGVILVNKKSK